VSEYEIVWSVGTPKPLKVRSDFFDECASVEDIERSIGYMVTGFFAQTIKPELDRAEVRRVAEEISKELKSD
jgi:hypothetical protein